ncbi:MAG: YceH family protein [Planctomycetales bacterium]|nr:YceH family protein [Planctomycetales bacterium]
MEQAESNESSPTWTILPRIERRVLGVLVEKAKTTPDQYPLSLNGLTNGCNQKSNRFPQMDLEPSQVEDALDSLRHRGAVSEVQGGGRVAKYRHYLKEWMGVDGTELAVMAELLLRGAQTVGELRGRAARMATGQLADMAALRPVLRTLLEKELIIELTPEGRGQVVTHALYEPQELEKVRRDVGSSVPVDSEESSLSARPAATPVAAGAATSAPSTPAPPPPAASAPASSGGSADVAALRQEVAALREELGRMKKEIEDLWSNF